MNPAKILIVRSFPRTSDRITASPLAGPGVEEDAESAGGIAGPRFAFLRGACFCKAAASAAGSNNMMKLVERMFVIRGYRGRNEMRESNRGLLAMTKSLLGATHPMHFPVYLPYFRGIIFFPPPSRNTQPPLLEQPIMKISLKFVSQGRSYSYLHVRLHASSLSPSNTRLAMPE